MTCFEKLDGKLEMVDRSIMVQDGGHDELVVIMPGFCLTRHDDAVLIHVPVAGIHLRPQCRWWQGEARFVPLGPAFRPRGYHILRTEDILRPTPTTFLRLSVCVGNVQDEGPVKGARQEICCSFALRLGGRTGRWCPIREWKTE